MWLCVCVGVCWGGFGSVHALDRRSMLDHLSMHVHVRWEVAFGTCAPHVHMAAAWPPRTAHTHALIYEIAMSYEYEYEDLARYCSTAAAGLACVRLFERSAGARGIRTRS
jgi:hypothetical protein